MQPGHSHAGSCARLATPPRSSAALQCDNTLGTAVESGGSTPPVHGEPAPCQLANQARAVARTRYERPAQSRPPVPWPPQPVPGHSDRIGNPDCAGSADQAPVAGVHSLFQQMAALWCDLFGDFKTEHPSQWQRLTRQMPGWYGG